MRVFISHNTKDKWLARRIADDLAGIGVDTFLDEKDIATGESIDDSIQAHLRDCDDFLVLLSPSSISSHWVLIEIGGAIALGKRLVPVLLYVDTNDIPKPITKHLARDISNIEKYYDEVRKRISDVPKRKAKRKTAPPKKKATKRKQTAKKTPTPFRVGDIVLIPSTQQSTANLEGGVTIGWTSQMDEFRGKKAKIAKVDADLSYKLDIDDEQFWWPHQWLKPVDK